MQGTGRRQRRWAALPTFTRGRCGAFVEYCLFGERAPNTKVTHRCSVWRVLVDEMSERAMRTPGLVVSGLDEQPAGCLCAACRLGNAPLRILYRRSVSLSSAYGCVGADCEGLAVPAILCVNDCWCWFRFLCVGMCDVVDSCSGAAGLGVLRRHQLTEVRWLPARVQCLQRRPLSADAV